MTEVSLEYARAGMAGPMAHIILAENEVLRRELAVVLRRLPAVGAVHQCPDWAGAERLLRAGRIDVLILTSAEGHRLRLLGRNGFRPKVLMLIDEPQAADPGPLASLPVDGFLLRQELSARTLHDALRRMAGGEIPMPAVLARQLLGRAGAEPGNLRPVSLTARENETLALLAQGLSNKQIARRLEISEHGVKRLVGSVLLKLGSPNRTTAVVTAMKYGIIDSL
ncbi:LuxR C-terminal-related transcriptional regulator [Nocardia sp. NPDC051570]|uniref:LuxR C-terminal-related transcriptional regulator n=1 Tax=Nocardia sp. NPDC051570 TaxID=3364324 RepID=UPI0037ACFAF0